MSVEIGVLIAIIGCFVGVAGYFAGRDKKIAHDSEWRGTVNAKLDTIIGIKKEVQHLEDKVQDHEGRIIKLESKKE